MATIAVGAAVASAASKLVKGGGQQALRRAPLWVHNMPTRQIANVLLQQDRQMMDYDLLYGAVEQSGLFRSKRHFKHCLRMLKQQNRVQVICRGPEKAGSAKRLFSVKLTRRGCTIYTRYSQMPPPKAEGNDEGNGDGNEKRGLAEVMV